MLLVCLRSTHRASCLTGWIGREMDERLSERGHGTLQKRFFLSLPCFHTLLILLQLFHFFNLININKTASSPPSTDFFEIISLGSALTVCCFVRVRQLRLHSHLPALAPKDFCRKFPFYLVVSENQQGLQHKQISCNVLYWREHCCWLHKCFYL